MSKKEPKDKEHEYYDGEAKFSPIPLHVSSPVIKKVDKGKIKTTAVEAMQKQANQQIEMLKKQAELIMTQVQEIQERVKISFEIYQADLRFKPEIDTLYHLYQDKEKKILSMIGPKEWGKNMPYEMYLATVKLLPDKTWEVIEKAEVSNSEPSSET